MQKENIDCRPRQDSNLQSPDPKSGALSIRPRGLKIGTVVKKLEKYKSISVMFEIAIFLLGVSTPVPSLLFPLSNNHLST